jgi:hypothetical protein
MRDPATAAVKSLGEGLTGAARELPLGEQQLSGRVSSAAIGRGWLSRLRWLLLQ